MPRTAEATSTQIHISSLVAYPTVKEDSVARVLKAVDLFCGAGGTSTGLLRACARLGLEVDLLAINHWKVAIATHASNHPDARHLCEDLATVDPRRVVPDGRLDLLVASPECTSHSYSRGNRPVSEQSRASAWHPLRWADQLRIDALIIENVAALRDWGPTDIHGRPIRSRKGETYQQYLAMLRAMGYAVDARVLNAADYGGATTRRRLFIVATKGPRPVLWPAPTHGQPGNVLGLAPWRAAREVIDVDDLGDSIFSRPKPLAPKTMERIFMGLERFGGPALQPVVAILRRHATGSSLDAPLPPALAGGQHLGVAGPVLVSVNHGHHQPDSGRGHGGRVQSLDTPLPALNTGDHTALVDARFLTPHRVWDQMRVDSIHAPLRTLDSNSDDIGLVSPVVTDRRTAQPLTGQFLIPFFGERGGQRPRTHSLEAPLPAPTSHGAGALASYLVKFYGTGRVQSLDAPLGSLTTHDRFGLVTPYGIELADGLYLDIRFRMLKVSELAAGMGFGESYRFEGAKKARVKQIGNAVEVHQAEALCYALLASRVPSLRAA
jgi:DNA (cytosine-5)-methyltransferase 1